MSNDKTDVFFNNKTNCELSILRNSLNYGTFLLKKKNLHFLIPTNLQLSTAFITFFLSNINDELEHKHLKFDMKF